MLVPKLVTTLKDYTRVQFIADLTAGIIVGIVALPLAIAFAIASGVTPERGLYSAIVAGFLISALGGSRVQIGGPTGAFVVIVYGIVQKFGVLSDVHTQPLVALGRSAVLDEIGAENVLGNIDDALNRAREYLGIPIADRPDFATPTVARETPGEGAPLTRGRSS